MGEWGHFCHCLLDILMSLHEVIFCKKGLFLALGL